MLDLSMEKEFVDWDAKVYPTWKSFNLWTIFLPSFLNKWIYKRTSRTNSKEFKAWLKGWKSREKLQETKDKMAGAWWLL